MTYAIQTPEDVINDALARAGFIPRVNSIYEGTTLAKKARDIYSQTRDDLIRNGEWEFAERVASGSLLKQAPGNGGYIFTPWTNAYPAPPWLFEYSYPSDCLKVRSVRYSAVFLPNFNPIFNRFSVENDNSYTPPVKVILCDVPGAIVTYAAQVTDPTTWETDFVEALSAALARRFGAMKDLNTTQVEARDEDVEMRAAMDEKG